MVECRYCGEVFDDEDGYLDHLAATHDGELSTIDRRRVADRDTATRSVPISATGAGVAIGIAIFAGVVIWGIFALGMGGGSAATAGDVAVTPTDLWGVHKHGTINMTVLGDQVDFSADRYQLQADAFHFEDRNGDRWHVHAREVTLEYAMATLGIEVNGSAVTFDGRTYRDGSPSYTVEILVDGESVTPATYRLQEGDHVRIVVRKQSK
ncbi:MAG: hypothetical protein ABEJ57_08285 [Halobacteriaceae archaeon]